ncbi:MAG: hypothetical protein WBW44_09305 [Solirubrobacterales bacterium]
MKLYVCWTEKELNLPGRDHPCAQAFDALAAVGYEPEVIRARSFGGLPDFLQPKARQLVKEKTGSSWVPALETDGGEWISGNAEIQAWAENNPSA